MRNKKIKIWLGLLAIIVVTFAIYSTIFKDSRNSYSSTNLSIGANHFFVELAETEQQKQFGLSGRNGLRENTGMLFVFQPPRPVGFWMKNMKFPIDIVWIDQNKKIVGFVENVTPESYPRVYPSGVPVGYVLEIESGKVSSSNIKIGDQANFDFPTGQN